jgi:pectinesterase inhibitor-like protein
MATTIASFKLILTFLVASASLLLLTESARPIDFHQWCKRTTHVDICNSIIQNDPRTNLKTSPSGILTILTDRAKAVVATCASKVVFLLKSPSSSPQLKEGLKKCWIAYKRATQTLALQDYSVVNKDTYKKLNFNLGRVYDQPVICETAFQAPVKSPLTPEDTDIMNIAEANAQILNIYECNQPTACIFRNGQN